MLHPNHPSQKIGCFLTDLLACLHPTTQARSCQGKRSGLIVFARDNPYPFSPQKLCRTIETTCKCPSQKSCRPCSQRRPGTCSTGVAPNGPHRPFRARVAVPRLSVVHRLPHPFIGVPSRCGQFTYTTACQGRAGGAEGGRGTLVLALTRCGRLASPHGSAS